MTLRLFHKLLMNKKVIEFKILNKLVTSFMYDQKLFFHFQRNYTIDVRFPSS